MLADTVIGQLDQLKVAERKVNATESNVALAALDDELAQLETFQQTNQVLIEQQTKAREDIDTKSAVANEKFNLAQGLDKDGKPLKGISKFINFFMKDKHFEQAMRISNNVSMHKQEFNATISARAQALDNTVARINLKNNEEVEAARKNIAAQTVTKDILDDVTIDAKKF